MSRSSRIAAYPLIVAAVMLGSVAGAEVRTYRVERIVSDRVEEDSATGIGPAWAQIELPAHAKPPARADLERIALVGTEGVANGAQLVEFEKRCEFLCGDENEECHLTALVGFAGEIGTPLLAVVGLAEDASDFAVSRQAPPAKPPASDGAFAPLAHPPDGRLSVAMEGNAARFSVIFAGASPHEYAFSATDCRWTTYAKTGFDRLACNGAAALFHDGRPLLFSYPDYNVPDVSLLSRFRSGDEEFHLVRIARKAYTAYGLLVRRDGAWIALITEADWAHLC